MRNAFLRCLSGLIAMGISVRAQDWPAIPPEVWAIKQDAGLSAHGAVIIEERIHYGDRETEVHRRIRIFAEAGKGAAALPAFSRLYEIEGRTVQADGTATPFNDSKDLISGSIKAGVWESKRLSLIPPGLTSDCVVDVHYRVESYLYGDWVEIPILGVYPNRKKVMEVPSFASLSSALIGLGNIRPEKVVKGRFNHFTFKDLPADEAEPYSLPTARMRPTLLFYNQPFILSDVAKEGAIAYWNEVGNKYYKYGYDTKMSFGRTYKDWSKALRAGLEGDPMVKAGDILARLEEQIQNGSHLTFAELAALPKKAAEERMDGHDLDATVRRRRTSDIGMHFIFFQLLLDEGLNPKLLLVADREKRIFQFDFPNIYQFTDVLIGVAASAGGLVWFNPSARYFPAGIVPPDYQATQGLLLDPKDWTCKPFVLGIQAAKANVSLYEFALTLGNEESFAMKALFSGYPEFVERNRFFSLEAKEQQRKLKEGMESGLKGYTISKVGVEHATDIRKNLVWSVEGVKEAEQGRRRVISPFPGIPYPLNMPQEWPETRKSPIVIPYCRVFRAKSTFKVPKGWTLGKEPDLVKSNDFGSVNWKVSSIVDLDMDEEQVEVTFSVEITKMLSDAGSYGPFKTFMGWIETATRRTLALERQS